MAITLDHNGFTGVTNQSSVTHPHTVGVDANLLLVWIATRSGTGATGVTWNGTAMTKKASVSKGTNCTAELWYLRNPAIGGYGVVATFAASESVIDVVSQSWKGVLGTANLFRHSITASGSSSTVTATVSSATGDLVVDFETQAMSTGQTADSGQTVLDSRSIGTPDSSWATSKKDGATNVTTSYVTRDGVAYPWAMISVSLAPSVLASRLDLTLSLGPPAFGAGGPYISPPTLQVTLTFTTIPSISKVLEARVTITDFTQMGRWIQLELSRTGDGPDFEINLVDVDIRFRGRRVWRDID